MKNLVIVESPAKSKTIEKYLGKDYKVVSSKGHIRDLATRGPGGLGVDVEDGFKATYSIPRKKNDIIKSLKADVADADFVYLATDPDREGEAISWHLAEVLGIDKEQNNRITFNEITKNAVNEALKTPRKIDMHMVESQETRRILDRIIGFKLSKLLQKKIHSKSAGRVQSVALRMICDREKEVKAFVPEEYWTIGAILDNDLELNLTKINGEKAEIKSEKEADDIISKVDKNFKLTDINEKEKNRASYLPFITSTLQQEANNKLGYKARRTMMAAQILYEGVTIAGEHQGLITYMRTDSTRLSKDFVGAAFAKIENEFGKEYVGKYRVKNSGESQDAHEAIRPTNLENTPEKVKPYLEADQYKIYKLIYARALASLMADAKTMNTTYTFDNNGMTFTASGSRYLFDGFLKAYSDYDNSKEVKLPKLSVGDNVTLKEMKKDQHFTEGPSRYTEAKLIKALEEEGVGRPSTYATIIDTIVFRNYVEYKRESDKSKTKYFFPTDQGIITDDSLKDYFSSVINIKYTANMETGLDEIAEAKKDKVEYLTNFYNEFIPLVEYAYDKMPTRELDRVGEPCPECGGELVYRNGRFGRFISCINFPKCEYTASAKKKDPPEPIGKNCPRCGAPLVKRKSRRMGTFFAGCSAYPNCTYMETMDGEEIIPKKKKFEKKEETVEDKPKKKVTKKSKKTK